MNRLPAALFIVDICKEYIAVKEAANLNIPVFAIVDTNSNPDDIKFVIPANDDSAIAIKLIVSKITDAVKEGLNERKADKMKMEKEKTQKAQKKKENKKEVIAKFDEKQKVETKTKPKEVTEEVNTTKISQEKK